MMKRLAAVFAAAALALSVTACSSAKDSAPVSENGYPEYHWNASMTVSETTINYKMVERFAQLLNEKRRGNYRGYLSGRSAGKYNRVYRGGDRRIH